MSDAKLSSLLTYLDNYLYVYRVKYKSESNANIPLTFLTNSMPAKLVINCCIGEPLINDGDYWYNGSVLRKWISNAPQNAYGFSRTYLVCNTYSDGFKTTLVSLNPDIKIDNVTVTTLLPPSGEFLRRSGDTATGPLYLFRDPEQLQEAANKAYVDNNFIQIDTQYSAEVFKLKQDIADLYFKITGLSKPVFYTHYQDIENDIWVVSHNKESTNFVISVFDASGSMIIPESVKISDANTVVISFNLILSGKSTLFFNI